MNAHLSSNCMPDAELVAEIVIQSEWALEELYRRYNSMLRSVIRRIMNNDAEIDDVIQDVFIHVWNHAADFSPEKGQLLGWLITIARRRSLDRVRQRSAYQRATTRFEVSCAQPLHGNAESCIVDKQVQQNELQSMLRVFIGNLPPLQGEVVHLTLFKGMSQREIANRLSLPLGTVKTRIELGMRKLKRCPLFQQAA
jgi:RNA polymerase sigma-70 factor (ECF subfamily)